LWCSCRRSISCRIEKYAAVASSVAETFYTVLYSYINDGSLAASRSYQYQAITTCHHQHLTYRHLETPLSSNSKAYQCKQLKLAELTPLVFPLPTFRYPRFTSNAASFTRARLTLAIQSRSITCHMPWSVVQGNCPTLCCLHGWLLSDGAILSLHHESARLGYHSTSRDAQYPLNFESGVFTETDTRLRAGFMRTNFLCLQDDRILLDLNMAPECSD